MTSQGDTAMMPQRREGEGIMEADELERRFLASQASEVRLNS